VLDRLVDEAADDIRTRRALDRKPCRRGRLRPVTGRSRGRRSDVACARIEATAQSLDIRFVVTNLAAGSAEHVYEALYCARGQAENLIKLHKSQLASDRTSCRSPLANQVRLTLHTAAYWLILTLRVAIPKTHALAKAEFATLRLRLLKLGTRVIETASRVRLAFAAACPDAALIRHLATASPDPEHRGRQRPAEPLPETTSAEIKSSPTKPGKPASQRSPISQRCPKSSAPSQRRE
jgi:DDE family transposase